MKKKKLTGAGAEAAAEVSGALVGWGLGKSELRGCPAASAPTTTDAGAKCFVSSPQAPEFENGFSSTRYSFKCARKIPKVCMKPRASILQ